ncbi:MAG: hypothetical protein IIY81_01630 [Lachnospiraceae bacterium]|nr:hypothetical protein [Lachnospiraceae bacterium]
MFKFTCVTNRIRKIFYYRDSHALSCNQMPAGHYSVGENAGTECGNRPGGPFSLFGDALN